MPLTIGPVEKLTKSHLVDEAEVDVTGTGEAAVAVDMADVVVAG
jgi:hypothetical protein